MSKQQDTKLFTAQLADRRKLVRTRIHNKYFELAKANFETDLNYRQWDYIFKRFWDNGVVAAFKINYIEPNPDDVLSHADVGFAMVGGQEDLDIYYNMDKIQLVNYKNFPLIPKGKLTVDKDVVVGYITGDRHGLYSHIATLIDQLVDIDMCMYINLLMQKCPYLISVDSTEVQKANDLLKTILFTDTPAIFAVDVNPATFKAVSNGAEYIIDKLMNYYHDVEDEILTFLGVNNSGCNKIEQLQLSEVNSNNEMINLGDDQFDTELKGFCERCKKVLGVDFYIRAKKQNDAGMEGQVHNNEMKTGPKDYLAEEGE